MKKIIAIGIIGLFLLSSFMITSAFGKDNTTSMNENYEINITILDDGDISTGSSTDNLVHVPSFDPGNNTVGTINTYFNVNISNITIGPYTDFYNIFI